MWRELFLWVGLFFFVVLLIIYFIIVMFKQTTVCVLLVMLCMSMTAVGQGLDRDVQIVGTNGEYPFGVLNDNRGLNTMERSAKQWQGARLDASCCVADVKFGH
jgi:hypothetical protein